MNKISGQYRGRYFNGICQFDVPPIPNCMQLMKGITARMVIQEIAV
jgi:hypothetical protein